MKQISYYYKTYNKGEKLFSLILSDEKLEIERFINLRLRISDLTGNIANLFHLIKLNYQFNLFI